LLRQLRGHTGAVRVTRFGSHGNSGHVVSMSDDRSVRLWDVGSEQCVTTVSGAHDDYIRAGCVAGEAGELWVSGGYDRCVKMWDLRAPAPAVASYDHGSPVECVLTLPGGALVASAGGNSIKIWDTLTGRAIAVMANHQKTVTSLCLEGTHTRLLSCGLDCMIKVYDLRTYTVAHSMRATTPLMAIATSPDNASLACGGADGSVAVRQRTLRSGERARTASRRRPENDGAYRYFLRGQGETASADDLVVESQRKQHLQPYDKYLRKFQYRNAVAAAMASREPIVVVSLLVELAHRQALPAALSGMDADALVPLLKFVRRNCTHPHYARILIDVANLLLDLYGSVISHSEEVLRNVQRLRKVLQAEMAFQKELFAMQGALDMLLASNSTAIGDVTAIE
jgi:U3 small nucleolar RNA-associated protein 15